MIAKLVLTKEMTPWSPVALRHLKVVLTGRPGQSETQPKRCAALLEGVRSDQWGLCRETKETRPTSHRKWYFTTSALDISLNIFETRVTAECKRDQSRWWPFLAGRRTWGLLLLSQLGELQMARCWRHFDHAFQTFLKISALDWCTFPGYTTYLRTLSVPSAGWL